MTKRTLFAILLTALATGWAEPVANAPAKGFRRARMPHERRVKDGKMPGLVTFSYGKTASGERTYVYRVMGQGGAVMDFTDYGAKPIRCYVPDAKGDLVNVIKARANVIDCEKAGELAEVWKVKPIRRPGATGLVFERDGGERTKTTERAERTNDAARVVYWLDAKNTWAVETTLPDTNAVKFAASFLAVPPFPGITNETVIALRPTTNVVQRLEWRLPVVK